MAAAEERLGNKREQSCVSKEKSFLISKNMSVFKDIVLLITRETGSIGNAVLNRFLETGIDEIRFRHIWDKPR